MQIWKHYLTYHKALRVCSEDREGNEMDLIIRLKGLLSLHTFASANHQIKEA
jgi:hypothetical protein